MERSTFLPAAGPAGGPAAGPLPGHRGAPPTRLVFVDNLRIMLIGLVILHHVACVYSGLPAWYYTERPGNVIVGTLLSVFLLVNQAWFMGAFFLLSGYFTPGSYDRKGARAFLRDRLVRLGIPLLAYYFVLNPILWAGSYHVGSPVERYLHTIGSGPLWFVLALVVFDLSYAALRLATKDHRDRRAGERGRFGYPAVAGFVVALALMSYVLRIVVPVGFVVPIVDFPSGDYLPQYVSFFALGVIAYRRGWFHAVDARTGWTGLGLAIVSTLVFLPLALTGGFTAFLGHGSVNSLFYALWDSGFAVGVVLALLALFRRRFDTQGPLLRHLSGHTFTVYVIHAFVVTATAYALSAVDLPTLVKVAAAALVAVPGSFALANPVRRLPGVRRVL